MLCWEDRERLSKEPLTEDEEILIRSSYRAGGEVICDVCGKKYNEHEDYLPSGKTNDGWPWLTKLCNGDLVKL